MLVFLMALFVLPILVVLVMYQVDYRPGGASHGQLLAPPKALQLTPLTDQHGQPFAAEQWHKKWVMVYVAAGACDAGCQQQVHLLRQIHVSLNKEIDRVQRVLIAPAADPAALAALQQQYPDLVILAGPPSAALAQQFGADGVYLVDPLGNLMMHYPAGYDAKGLREDMTRLLKYSWVG